MVPYYKRNVYYKNISNTFIFKKKKKIGFKKKKKKIKKKKIFHNLFNKNIIRVEKRIFLFLASLKVAANCEMLVV